MWLLVHPENLIVWTLDWNEIFIAQTYWFFCMEAAQRDMVQAGSFCVSITVIYL